MKLADLARGAGAVLEGDGEVEVTGIAYDSRHVVSGDLFPDRGEVRFAGRPVTWVDAAVRCRLGVGRTYQVPRPFESMTVWGSSQLSSTGGRHDI